MCVGRKFRPCLNFVLAQSNFWGLLTIFLSNEAWTLNKSRYPPLLCVRRRRRCAQIRLLHSSPPASRLEPAAPAPSAPSWQPGPCYWPLLDAGCSWIWNSWTLQLISLFNFLFWSWWRCWTDAKFGKHLRIYVLVSVVRLLHFCSACFQFFRLNFVPISVKFCLKFKFWFCNFVRDLTKFFEMAEFRPSRPGAKKNANRKPKRRGK